MPNRKTQTSEEKRAAAAAAKFDQGNDGSFKQHRYDDFYENPYEQKGTLPVANRSREELDSGYAWVVCLAACLLYVTTDGICFSLGIFFPVFLETFGESVGFTSWISSILLGSMLLSGPLVSYLVARFGARKVCILGALLAAIGCVISMMATGVWFLIGSLGCLTGFGFGCMMIPALVSVTTWFDKRRPLAIGLTICGAGAGMFLYSTIVTLLLELFELSGCLMVLGAIILHGCVFGLLLRPPPARPMEQNDNVNSPQIHSKFDLAVFKNFKYDAFLLAVFHFGLGFFPVFMFVTSRAVTELHWSHLDAGFLLTIVAICNVTGRILCTVSLGQTFLPINKLVITALAMLAGGVAVSLSMLCNDYTTMVVFCVFYGLSGGFVFVALPVVMAELVIPQHVEISSGFFVFALGMAALLGIPSAGVLVDLTGGNYTLLFLIAGSSICLGALLLGGIAVANKISRP